ncbi:hypothetical protein [Adhaeribacter aquaticus]|nr:hypothetical protein [Adhaeribacter aquaticus]
MLNTNEPNTRSIIGRSRISTELHPYSHLNTLKGEEVRSTDIFFFAYWG